MRLEGHHKRRETLLLSHGDEPLQNRFVAEMNAVERAYGNRCRAGRQRLTGQYEPFSHPGCSRP
jgi:hypothetical protein